MRIAIDVRRIRDFGIGTYLRNLLQALGQNTGEPDGEHSFCLIGAPGEENRFADLPAHFRFVPHPVSDMARVDHLALPMLLRKLNVDLTHIPLNRIPLFLPRPYVVTVHDLSNLLFDESPTWHQQLRRYRFVRGVTRAERIISVSAATRRDLVNFTGVAVDRIHTIHNAPDPRFFEFGNSSPTDPAVPESRRQERCRILERYQIQHPFLLYVGHIRKQKNIPRLVEAFAVARQNLSSHPDLHALRLLIIGDEIYKHPEVRRAVIQSRVEDSVRFLGFVPFDTLRVFYELANAFVFPSLYEGFGLPPLEAMACGTPVLTSTVSSLPEVVEDAAVIVNPENVFDIARGICEVLTNADLRVSLIAKGRARAAAFSWDAAARDTLAVYRQAAGFPASV